MELTFDAETHTYRIDGRVVPSVTQILSAAGLTNFAGIDPAILAAAAQRGTFVHQSIEMFDADDLDFDELDPALKGYVAAYAKWKAEAMWVPQSHEQAVCDPVRGYAGTLDQVGLMGFVPYIIDIKSGDVYRSAGYQLAAYQACLPDGAKLKRAAVQLFNDEHYRIHKFDSRDDLKIFYAALTVVQAQAL